MTDVDALLAEFEQTRDTRRQCKVCDSEHRELIDKMLARAGGPSIKRFLRQRLGYDIAASTLARHKDEHLHDGSRPAA